ncbi:MAG: DUF4340 domain-containing protein [Opitutales bacterium]|nr:DUF4340 domain-containing protein [Opitutales bacterium]
MRFKLTFLLLVLNVALFSIIFYMDKHADSERAFMEQSSLVLAPGSVEKADTISLDGPGAPVHWVLRRQGQNWRMEKPQQWPVNRFAVEQILDQLRFLRMETSFPVSDIGRNGSTLADYGLENPSITLTLGDADAETVIRIGAPTKMGGRLYLLSPDEQRVFITDREILRSLLVEIDSLRNTQVFNLPAYTVSSLSIQRTDGGRVRLAKRGSVWEFESPIRVGADSGAVESLLAELTELKLKDFVNQDPAAQGLLSPRMRIGIEAADQRQSLLIGAAHSEGLVYAKLEDSPEVFTVSSALPDRLVQAQEALRERRFNSFDKAKLGEIHIAMGSQSATLQKLETGEWQVLRQSGESGVETWKADSAIVIRLIDSLHAVKAQRFVSDAPSEADLQSYGFADPQRVVTLKLGNATRSLVIGDLAAQNNGVYAKIGEEPFVYETSATILNQLSPVPLSYRSRLLDELPPAARLLRLRLGKVGEEAPLIDLGPMDGQDWSAIIEEQSEGRGPAIGTLLNFIRAGEVKEYIAARYEDALPLGAGESAEWVWKLEADIELPSGSEQSTRRTLSFTFTDPVGGTTQFGGSAELGLMFSLPDGLIDALHALCFDHPAPAPELIPDVSGTEDPGQAQ